MRRNDINRTDMLSARWSEAVSAEVWTHLHLQLPCCVVILFFQIFQQLPPLALPHQPPMIISNDNQSSFFTMTQSGNGTMTVNVTKH